MSTNAASAARESRKGLLPGLLLTLALAAMAFGTFWVLQGTWLKFSALLWAFIYSIVVANFLPAATGKRYQKGIDFASSRLLRWAIALLGLTVSASVWTRLGLIGFAVVLINLAIASVFGFLFCRYVLKLEGTLPILLSVGTSICGASAIAAAGPALKAKAEEMGLSIAAITLFGLAAMFAYPLLFNGPLSGWLAGNAQAFGMWAGMGVHETAQVIAAASQVDAASPIAVSAKMVRIFMIGPMVFIGLLVYRKLGAGPAAGQVKAVVPWFAVAFILLTMVNLGLERMPFAGWWGSFNSGFVKQVDAFLLAWSFAAVGLKVKASSIRAIGLKAFVGGLVVALAAGATALLLVRYVWLPFVH